MSAPAQRSFTAGEVSPALYARTDLAAYARGLRTLRNAVVMKTGGAQSRAGTTYKGSTKSNTWTRLIAVAFDDDQNYILELGNGFLRFRLNGDLVTATIVGAWANTTAYTIGQVVSHSGTNYVALQSHTSNTANDRPNDGTNRADYWYALTGTIYELPTPWTTQAIARTLQYQVDATTSTGMVRFAYNGTSRRTLTRITANTWSLTVVTSGTVSLAPPANLTTDAATPGDVASWVVTAYDAVNDIESLPSSPVSSDTAPDSPSSVFTEGWDAVTGATHYRVYRSDNLAAYYFLRETTGLTLIDTGILPDTTRTPPVASATWSDASDYPGVIGAYQQRVLLAGSTRSPATVRGSRVGLPDNFTVHNPIEDGDGVSWTMVGSHVVRPRHFLEVAQRLWLFANTGEYLIEGDETGIIVPGGVNPRRISANGTAVYPPPLEVNDTALYVQARGNVVRDLLAGEAGSDLTVTGSHLLVGYTILEWAYQQTPHSVVWAVRSDGVLLSLTYQREAGILAWARHDTDGTVESVACVQESTEDALYLVVNRTINSGTVRYVERLANRAAAITALVCSDASLTTTMAHPHSTLSIAATGGSPTGGGYLYTGLTATGSGGTGSFASTDVGRTFSFVKGGLRGYGRITAYTSATVVTVTVWWPSANVLSNPEAITTANWWWTSVGLLTHLVLEAVSVVADGTVLASPYDASASATVTVSSTGNANLGGLDATSSNIASLTDSGDATTASYTTTIVGLPFVVDLGTLDLDRVSSSGKDAGINVTRVGLWLESSRTPWCAQSFPTSSTSVTGMQRMPAVDADGNTTTALLSDYREVQIDGIAFTNAGRTALRHVDPSPFTVLAIVPQGTFGRS